MGEFRMPSLGADMVSGRLLQWRVKPGDEVHRGDIVASVDTSKAEIDIEIFEDGVIDAILVDPGEKVPVGAVLATVRPIGSPEPAPAAAPPKVAATTAPPAASTAPAPPAPPVGPTDARPLASPLARRLAAGEGVDLAGVTGSGPDGAVLAGDVTAGAAAQPAPAAPSAEPDRATSMRQAIAAAMARSKREIPHFYRATTIDMMATLDWLAVHNAELPVRERLLPAACTLKAVALAAREVPSVNGHWVDGTLRPSGPVHAGVAIALRGGGLIAPAIHDVQDKGLDDLMRELRDLIARARSGGLRSSELTDATLTVTSLGDRGAEVVHGVIYPPQVALIGFGRVVERAVARDGLLGARKTVTVSLAADHRATDGHEGSAFLAAIDRLLQTPEEL